MENDSDHIFVVLVEPKEPGNIGSVVRAMKNMGISHLRLVNPPPGYRDNSEQKKFGYRAQDITQKCKEFSSLADALADISVAFLATNKQGKWKRDFLLPEQAAEIAAQHAVKEKIAFIFGREVSGVTVDESQMANHFIYIPMAGSYPSLNLSQAVLVVLYEVFKKIGKIPGLSYPKTAAKKEFERLYDNLWQLMKTLFEGFQRAGVHKILWDGTNLQGQPDASGLYLCQFSSSKFSTSQKMLLLK